MSPPSDPGTGRGAARGGFAHPVLSLLIAVCWLALQRSLEPAHLISAAVLAWLVPRLIAGFIGPRSRLQRPLVILRFAGIVAYDIAKSNLVVARLVLDPRRRPQPAWVPVDSTLEHPGALALLAMVITMTPGTVSCVVREGQGGVPGRILVHALDCSDPAALAAEILERYESPIREIFR